MSQPAAPIDSPTRSLRLPSGPLAVADDGAGVPIVAVHGLPGSSRDFRWLVPCLVPRFRVVRIDLPGFGDTPATTASGLSIAHRGALVLATLDALGLERALLLSHSMGTAAVVAAACEAPDRVTRLALIAPSGRRSHLPMKRRILRTSSALLRRRLGRVLLRPVLRKGFAEAGFPRPLTDESRVMTTHYAAATSFEDYGALLDRLSVPTLVAWADDDRVVAARRMRDVADSCPPGPRLRFAEGGHNIQKTQAVEIARAIGDWLR